MSSVRPILRTLDSAAEFVAAGFLVDGSIRPKVRSTTFLRRISASQSHLILYSLPDLSESGPAGIEFN